MKSPAPASTKPKAETATARVTILMTPSEKRSLFSRAKHAGFESVGAYLRAKAFAGEDANQGESLQALNTRLGRIEASIADVSKTLSRSTGNKSQSRTP